MLEHLLGPEYAQMWYQAVDGAASVMTGVLDGDLILLLFVAMGIDFGLFVILPWFRGLLPPLIGLPYGVVGMMARKLNRDDRGGGTLAVRGFITFIFATAVSFALGAALYQALLATPMEKRPWVMSILVFWLISFGGALRALRVVVKTIKSHGKNIEARKDLYPVLIRYRWVFPDHLSYQDGHAMVRSVAEAAAHSLQRYLVAPLFWWLLAVFIGVSPFMLVSVVIVMSVVVSVQHPMKRKGSFCWLFYWADTVLQFAPARITGLVIMAATWFVPGTSASDAMFCLTQQSYKSYSMNDGCALASMAGALGIALPAYHPFYRWFSAPQATARARREHLNRILGICVVSWLICGLAVAVMLLLASG